MRSPSFRQRCADRTLTLAKAFLYCVGPCCVMALLTKDTIRVVAESHPSLGTIKDDVAAALAQDVEYRLREIVQVHSPHLNIKLDSFMIIQRRHEGKE